MKIDVFTILFFILTIIYCIYIIVYEKRSIKSKLIEKSISLSKYKTIISSEEIYDKYLKLASIREEKKYSLPKYIFKSTIEKNTLSEMDYYIINKNNKLKKIFYLHGGSYISNPLIFHWIFLDDLAKLTNLEIIVPIYPKSPNNNYKKSYDIVLELYNTLFSNRNNVIIMGDSAGGGFSLGMAMLLKRKEGIVPSNIILLSPWLDITMSNNDMKKYEKKDPLLSRKALIKAGMLWSNNEDRSNYLLSPINGDFKNIGKITLFVGTHEIFLPDCRKMKKILENGNIDHNYFEYKNMDHVFPLYPIPEAKDVKNRIIAIIDK